MIKRLLKKHSEQLVKKFEYYRVGIQQEIDERQKLETLRKNTAHAHDVHNHHSLHSHSPRLQKHAHSPTTTTRQAPPPTRMHNGILLPRQQQQKHSYATPSPHQKSAQLTNHHRHRETRHATLPHANPTSVIYPPSYSNLRMVPPEMLQGLDEAFV